MLRVRARTARAAIAPDAAERAARHIARLFFESRLSSSVRSVGGYMPIRHELSPAPLLTELDHRGVICALPVVVDEDSPLIFRRYRPDDRLAAGAYGILEPLEDQEVVEPELVFAPLLAFDDRGTRLGYGAGHYDQTLAQLSAISVGLAFASQQVDSLPRASHDIALDYVLTEKFWLVCGAGN